MASTVVKERPASPKPETELEKLMKRRQMSATSNDNLSRNLSVSESIEAKLELRELEKENNPVSTLPKKPSEIRRMNSDKMVRPNMAQKPAFQIGGKVEPSGPKTGSSPIGGATGFMSLNSPTEFGTSFKPKEIDLEEVKLTKPSGHNSLKILRGQQQTKLTATDPSIIKLEPPTGFTSQKQEGEDIQSKPKGGAQQSEVFRAKPFINSQHPGSKPAIQKPKPNVARKPSLDKSNLNINNNTRPSVGQKPKQADGSIKSTAPLIRSGKVVTQDSQPSWAKTKLKVSTPNKGTDIPELKGDNVKKFLQQKKAPGGSNGAKTEWATRNESRCNSRLCACSCFDDNVSCHSKSCLNSWSAA